MESNVSNVISNAVIIPPQVTNASSKPNNYKSKANKGDAKKLNESFGKQNDEKQANLINTSPNGAKKWQNTDKKKKQTPPNNNQRFISNKKSSPNSQLKNNDDKLDLDITDTTVYDLSVNGSLRSGSKKTNLNHLLNFKYESARELNENYYEYEKFTKQFWSTKLSKNSYFSKEQFLQANCQFVVKNTGDYSIHMADPDLLVDWEKIEEIHIDSHECISCPICLYPPQAAKMTKCGHIYCWSCVLHYLSLSDKPWRKCPICFECIYKKDLKSVLINKYLSEFKIGDQIKMNLMYRSKHKYSTLILPVCLQDQFKQDEKSKASISFEMLNSNIYSNFKQYFKIHSKSSSEIYEQILCRERNELNNQQEMEKDAPEICFVHEALQLLDERDKSLTLEISTKNKNKKSIEQSKRSSSECDKSKSDMQSNAELVCSDAFEDSFIEKVKENPDTSHQVNVKTIESSDPKLTNQQSLNGNDLVYFYQSFDGQRIYISALNARCMITEYSSFSECPADLTARILSFESYFMTEENRKRFKYLSHLPLHSEFKIVELDLKEPILSQKTLDMHEEEIEERKRIRTRKELREKRNADRAAAADPLYDPHYYNHSAMNEPKYISSSSSIKNNIDYTNEFPEASTSPTASSGASISGTSSSYGSNTESVNKQQQQQNQQFSFAQMLKHPQNEVFLSADTKKNASLIKTSNSNAWPSLEDSSFQSPSSIQPVNQLNGWVSMAKLQQQNHPSLGRTNRRQDAPAPLLKAKNIHTEIDMIADESEERESMPAPLYQESFFSAIDESLRIIESKKFDSMHEKIDQIKLDENGGSQKEKFKKKKKSKQLLFSTSLNMGVN